MPARSARGLGVQVAQGAKPNAQFTGNLGHRKVRVRCQLDSSVAELREDISTVAFALILSGSPPPVRGSRRSTNPPGRTDRFTPTRIPFVCGRPGGLFTRRARTAVRARGRTGKGFTEDRQVSKCPPCTRCSTPRFIGYSDTIPSKMQSREILADFDQFLVERGLVLDAVVVGGTALVLLGIISRATKDVDVLYPNLSPDVIGAAREFARQRRATGETLVDDWLNNGPHAIIPDLPPDWMQRVNPVYQGQALTIAVPDRPELLATKLFALCDRGTDLADCLALDPSAAELATVLPWLVSRDAHVGWPAHVRETIADLAGRLGHGN